MGKGTVLGSALRRLWRVPGLRRTTKVSASSRRLVLCISAEPHQCQARNLNRLKDEVQARGTSFSEIDLHQHRHMSFYTYYS